MNDMFIHFDVAAWKSEEVVGIQGIENMLEPYNNGLQEKSYNNSGLHYISAQNLKEVDLLVQSLNKVFTLYILF